MLVNTNCTESAIAKSDAICKIYRLWCGGRYFFLRETNVLIPVGEFRYGFTKMCGAMGIIFIRYRYRDCHSPLA